MVFDIAPYVRIGSGVVHNVKGEYIMYIPGLTVSILPPKNHTIGFRIGRIAATGDYKEVHDLYDLGGINTGPFNFVNDHLGNKIIIQQVKDAQGTSIAWDDSSSPQQGIVPELGPVEEVGLGEQIGEAAAAAAEPFVGAAEAYQAYIERQIALGEEILSWGDWISGFGPGGEFSLSNIWEQSKKFLFWGFVILAFAIGGWFFYTTTDTYKRRKLESRQRLQQLAPVISTAATGVPINVPIPGATPPAAPPPAPAPAAPPK